jgi:tRNA(Ile2)-agmatinylcytidine synthase
MIIGIDDTDSVNGMCTTYLAAKLCRSLKVTELPRLIRLNPNIPFKTRGNGAIAFNSSASGTEKKVLSYIRKYSRLEDEKTNPGVVFLKTENPPTSTTDFYRRAVSELVTIKEAEDVLRSVDATYHKFKNGRGIIGALSAVGFTGDHTYELIAYRSPKNFGTKRRVDKNSVLAMHKNTFPNTFDNLSPKGDRLLIIPSGKDPIFCGIRGTSLDAVQEAWTMVRPEETIDMVQVFITNQATDAHLRKKAISTIRPYDCVSIKGTVTGNPKILRGGHVFFKITDDSGAIDCAAYKKSGSFRSIVSQLTSGDVITAHGGIGKYPKTLNLEKIDVHSLRDLNTPQRPTCCNKRMASAGKNQGLKCKKCNKKISQDEINVSHDVRSIKTGVYDVPPGSRRHISKPAFMLNQH